MMLALTLVAAQPETLKTAGPLALQALASAGARVKEPRHLCQEATDYLVEADTRDDMGPALRAALQGLAIDYALQPWEGRKKRLLLADMDSTIIGCECLDELADFAGRKADVAAITERAMRGELDFAAALRERVAMLKGLELSALQACYDDRVRLNPGAKTLLATMSANGAKAVLVSGGFGFFASRVARAAGFHEHHANSLIDDGSRLTGAVGDPILGRDAKLHVLNAEAAALGLRLDQTLAVGDGANDLLMIQAAGLGVAYRAKPLVADQTFARVEHTELTALLYFQGYRASEFIIPPDHSG